MARRPVRTGHATQDTVSELRGELASSTLAAQLVHQISYGNQKRRKDESEAFQALLAAVQEHDIEATQQTKTTLAELDFDYRLLEVIIKAGLFNVTPKDLSDAQKEQSLRISQSLDAINLMLSRRPQVLSHVPQAQDVGEQKAGPLHYVLLQRLIIILLELSDEEVVLKASKTLEIMLLSENTIHTRINRPGAIRRVLSRSVEEICGHIESRTSSERSTSGYYQLQIPLERSDHHGMDVHDANSAASNCLKFSGQSLQRLAHCAFVLIEGLFQLHNSENCCLVGLEESNDVSAIIWISINFTRLWTAMQRPCSSENVFVSEGMMGQSHSQILRINLGLLRYRKILDLNISFSVSQALIELVTCMLLGGHEAPRADGESLLCLGLVSAFYEILDPLGISDSACLEEFYAAIRFAARRDAASSLGQVLQIVLKKLGHEKSDDSRINCADLAGLEDDALKQKLLELPSASRPQAVFKDSEASDRRSEALLNDASSEDQQTSLRKIIYQQLKLKNAKSRYRNDDLISAFNQLESERQCALFQSIGSLACTMSQKSRNDEARGVVSCAKCDIHVKGLKEASDLSQDIQTELLSVFVLMTKSVFENELRQPRIAALLALPRLASHLSQDTEFDLAQSTLGQICLNALQSSNREIRVAASQTIPCFLCDRFSLTMTTKNRHFLLDSLRKLSDSSLIHRQEACVLTWARLARVIPDGKELNLVLSKLVQYLGNSNVFIAALAYDEIQIIANHSPFTAIKLFAPCWRTIAVTVLQDLYRRPQVVQQLSEILAMTVDEFLVMTQAYTVPFLVVRKRKDLLQRIAAACNKSIMTLCRDQTNLAGILVAVLLASRDNVEALAKSLLNTVSPEFASVDCAELLRCEPQATAAELLKVYSDCDIEPDERAQALRSLEVLADLTSSKPSSSRQVNSAQTIGTFFENHVLGIMAMLTETINDGRGPQPTIEKLRCLGAVQEMIRLATTHVVDGLPQICACLRAAMTCEELLDYALRTWLLMMQSLGEDEIIPLCDPTFALIIQHWSQMTPDVQKYAYDTVGYLLTTYDSAILAIVHTLPSLNEIPIMAKHEKDLRTLKDRVDIKHHFEAFCLRLKNENITVVMRALQELSQHLDENQEYLQSVAKSDRPDKVLAELCRSLLDTATLYGTTDTEIARLCGICLGSIGCLDPTRIETARERPAILVLSNFAQIDETRNFIIVFLQDVLVKAFLSATNSRSQGFLAYAIQELLSLGEFRLCIRRSSRDASADANYRRWSSLPESMRTVLTPFLNSKYFLTAGVEQPAGAYPLYRQGMSHTTWLKSFCFDLLRRDWANNITKSIFSPLSRIIRFQDVSIARYLLPYAILNAIITNDESLKGSVAQELLNVLSQPLEDAAADRDSLIACSQTIFDVLDYLSRWMQEKRKDVSISVRSTGRGMRTQTSEQDVVEISSVEAVLALIPADAISNRALACKSYARALFHWEQYIRQSKQNASETNQIVDFDPHYQRLQAIYSQIDEPDGVEGISAHLQVLDIDQQILEHKESGRWEAAQSWHEIQLANDPDNLDIQRNLLVGFRESGQHDLLLNQVMTWLDKQAGLRQALPYAVEAAWTTSQWDMLDLFLQRPEVDTKQFNVQVGSILNKLRHKSLESLQSSIDGLRISETRRLTSSNTTSLQECHETMLRLQALSELEAISKGTSEDSRKSNDRIAILDRRLDLIGPFFGDKQYVLSIRRAAMQLVQYVVPCISESISDVASYRPFTPLQIASNWLASAKLARQNGSMHQAFGAVLRASQLGDASATIEHARLLWHEGNRRKAIQSLQGAIKGNVFGYHELARATTATTTSEANKQQNQNISKAKAHLLLAKWTDRAGQSQSDQIIAQYKEAILAHNRWERGHYYLGKHYNKLFESERAKPHKKQALAYITGETAKLVVENYCRAICFGAKYIYQTLPRILTLWLDLGIEAEAPLDARYRDEDEYKSRVMAQRRKMLGLCNSAIKRYTERLPAFVFYTALPQTVARICHPNQSVYCLLIEIVAKVVNAHAPQALWTLLAMLKAENKERAKRGLACMVRVQENAKMSKSDPKGQELKNLMTAGQRFSDQLVSVCNKDVTSNSQKVSLSKDIGFNHKNITSKLAMPIQACLTASLPTAEGISMKSHKAFNSNDYISIASFSDEVLVLNSLQRPRKISLRGSDGRTYALLCKPKDDLRKDQRLMEFNAMINRLLKRDPHASKRRLYIKTYAVTPLNEECGLIEWVDNLRTLRDILLAFYKQKNIQVNYGDVRNLMNEAISAPSKLHIFTSKVLRQFPCVFHEWFSELFPEPATWFNARLRYTRSCAVMSIVGHVLGLGDRHGENILFEETDGGTFHVDFNCLFDKGLTFEKPEVVPFRLTHNMVDAFGAYGYEGPFRKSCEITNTIVRQHEDTLMTILETFVYDPTADFLGTKRKRNTIVPDTPEGVLDSVRNKLRGLLPGESVPLSAEGYVDELIRQATDPFRLASMYIGWCPFF